MHSTIRYSTVVRDKVKNFMDRLVMTMENMENVWLIICSTSKWEIFQSFKAEQYLQNSLLKPPSSAFLIKWAQCFLARSYLANNVENKRWENLLKEYIDRLKKNQQHMTDVFKAIDEILDKFQEPVDRQRFSLAFINRVVELCFDIFLFDKIYSVIDNGLFHVQNERFRVQFQKTFDSTYLSDKKQNMFKVMTDTNNPLVALIELDRKQTERKSVLVRDLIELICKKITITTKELLKDTFEQPTRSTITYCILFDKSLTTLPIHEKLLDQLHSIWDKWGKDGFLVTEINTWSTLEESDKQIVCQIWNFVAKYLTKSTDLQQLIDQAKRKIEEINKTMENVSLCIKHFCHDAIDQKDYLTNLQDIEKQVNEATTNTATISPKLEELKPFADRIRSLTISSVWQEYLRSKFSSFLRYLVYHRFRASG